MSEIKISKAVLSHPVHLLAFGFGSGLSPKAPGTVGTVVAVILYLFLAHLPVLVYSVFLILALVIGVYICERSSKLLGVHDHGGIVWDEFVGYWIAMFLAPSGWIWVITGFILFRLFDILKPFPINIIDKKIHGGLGIMLDDVLAGIFAWLFLQLLAIGVVI